MYKSFTYTNTYIWHDIKTNTKYLYGKIVIYSIIIHY